MAAPTFGIEEEFLLCDAASLLLREDAESIRAVALEMVDGGVDHELRTAMVETGTAVCADLETAGRELDQRRGALRAAAESAGALVLASASHPTARPESVDYSAERRYRLIADQFGPLADETLVCGCHVHVQVPDRETGVAVIDRIRPWLAPLIALSANSPYWRGEDTGYDSWRSRVWSTWPTAGPTSAFGDIDGYERRADVLVGLGAAVDRAMLYYDARVSEKWPTVEVRVADVCLTRDDALVVGGVTRALVMTALRSLQAPRVDVSVEVLRAAAFAASRAGLAEQLVDPADWTLQPAASVIDRLLSHVAGGLEETNDSAFVAENVARLLTDGNAAARQRAAWRRGGAAAVIEAVTLQ
jgi:carboxylate-amine ligase